MSADIAQGDVFWVNFRPPVGSEPGYRRPAVVVQGNRFNQSKLSTVVVCSITSNLSLARAPGNVLLAKGEANLPKPSVVNVSQISTVNKMDLGPTIGKLSRARLSEIIGGIALLLEPR